MCFAPQRRAILPHPNFKTWSGHGVSYAFWLGNVLRTTAACNFLISEIPKVVGTWCVLYILTRFAPQRRAIFHFSAGQLYLRTRLFIEPTLRPSGTANPQIIGKTANRDFPNISRTWSSFYWHYFLLALLLCSAFHFSFHIVGSWSSKLPYFTYCISNWSEDRKGPWKCAGDQRGLNQKMSLLNSSPKFEQQFRS